MNKITFIIIFNRSNLRTDYWKKKNLDLLATKSIIYIQITLVFFYADLNRLSWVNRVIKNSINSIIF